MACCRLGRGRTREKRREDHEDQNSHSLGSIDVAGRFSAYLSAQSYGWENQWDDDEINDWIGEFEKAIKKARGECKSVLSEEGMISETPTRCCSAARTALLGLSAGSPQGSRRTVIRVSRNVCRGCWWRRRGRGIGLGYEDHIRPRRLAAQDLPLPIPSSSAQPYHHAWGGR